MVELIQGDKDLSSGHGAAIAALKIGAATPNAHRGSVNDAMLRAAQAGEPIIAANCIIQGGNCQSATIAGGHS